MSTSLPRKDTLADFVEKPVLARAIEYQDQNTLRKVSEDGKYTPFPCFSTQLKDLANFGVGLHLYFHFLKSLCILFLLISLVSVWPMVIHFRGDNIKDDMDKQHSYNTLSLANESGDDIAVIRPQIIAADLTYTWFFIVFLLVYRVSSQRIVARSEEKSHKLSTYAVAVKKLPLECTQDEVKAHFQQLGWEVVQVHLARQYNDKLYDYRKRADLSYRLGVATLKAQAKGKTSSSSIKLLKLSIRTFDQRIAKKEKQDLRPHDALPVDRAYVVFALAEDRDMCVKQYAKARKWWRSAHKQPTELQFKEKYPLHVKPAPEPSTILWENLEITLCQKLMRTVVITLATLALLIGSVALLFWLKSRESDLPSSIQCKKDYGITQDTVYSSTFSSEEEIDCFCLTRSFTKVMSGKKVCDTVNCVKLDDYCSDFLDKWYKALYTKILSCFGIIAINFFLLITLKLLTAIERPPTVDKMKSRLLTKVFIAMFVNTTIITLLVNADFQRYVNSSGLFDGKYDDFVEDWYITVGSTLVVTLFIGVFSPHCVNLIVFKTIREVRRCCCWKCAATQQELNAMYVGPEFDLAVKYAVALNLVFSCFLYSGGLPLLNCFCFVGLFCIYWVDKYLILRYYHKPPIYNEALNTQALNFLPVSVILHCAVSLYMYGSDTDFPPKDSTLSERITSSSGLLLILFMIIAVVAGFFSYVVVEVYLCVRGRKKQEKKKPPYNEAIESLRQIGISSYNILDNEVYAPLIYSMSSAYTNTRKPEEEALSNRQQYQSDYTDIEKSKDPSDTGRVDQVVLDDVSEEMSVTDRDIEVKKPQ